MKIALERIYEAAKPYQNNFDDRWHCPGCDMEASCEYFLNHRENCTYIIAKEALNIEDQD